VSLVADSPTAEPQHHPAVRALAEQRANSFQLRLADGITRFAGSMQFVYLHALLFTVWMCFFERSPWPTLTLIVSLEAIFLSTFVMIGQNRQAQFQQDKADHDFAFAQHDLRENTELTRLIVQALHANQSTDGSSATRPGDP
jgi:uncharacterized membrane protein